MKKSVAIAVAVVGVSAAFAVVPRMRAAGAQESLTLPWMQPPAEFRDMQKQGFHAGVEAAIKDFDHHKDPDLERHKQYVKPKVDRSFVPEYRDGYRRGYNDAYKHLQKTHSHAS